MTLILLGATTATFLGAGCTEELGQRCNGQTIEQWRSGNLSGGRWEEETTCAEDRGQVCRVFDVASHNFPNHAFCVTSSAPDPVCQGMTGRFCAANNTLFICVEGFRIASTTYFDRCPPYRPHCYEPRPGFAFCVEDPTPAPECAGQTPRRMDYCATDNAVCREADFVQYCLDATTSVTCLDGVLIKKETCTPSSADGSATCVETSSVEVGVCTYASPSPSP